MPFPSFILLLVDQPDRSAAFYADLLGLAPLERSPTFAMFGLPDGPRLCLWSRHTVAPPPGAPAGAVELGFMVEDVDATCADWRSRGLRILQEPADLDFGRTFTALDPDGHRLRAFRPA